MNVTFPEHLAQLMKHEGINNEEGFEEAEGVFREDPASYGGINWRDRALIAETKLANLRIKLGEMLNEL